jgi:hypothetical protein
MGLEASCPTLSGFEGAADISPVAFIAFVVYC